MGARRRVAEPPSHSAAVRQIHERVLAGSPVDSRTIETGAGSGQRVHLLETGSGPPVVLLHGTNGPALFWMPLLRKLGGVRAIAPDRPGQGLSDPIGLPRNGYRAAAVGWLDRLFDTLELDTATLVGHSAGGLWALWYALARPDRVRRLAMIGTPALPGTRVPLPYRLFATPGLGELIGRLAPPTAASVRQFAGFMGEGATLGDYPDLIDLMVAAGRDPVAGAVDRFEARRIVSPLSLLMRGGFTRRARVLPAELRELAMPTLLIWGDRDPVGSVAAVSAVAELIPDGRILVLPAGHVPHLGHPEQIAEAVADLTSHGSQPGRTSPAS